MNNINLLDCTLRDGGYVNNWNFGAKAIDHIIAGLEKANIEIIELGFLRNEKKSVGRSSFARIEDINNLIQMKKHGVLYSAMIEAFNPYPLEQLLDRTESGIDLIRVCIWKRCMDKHIVYCREVANKGYKLSVQPSRVEQYNDNEFIDMLKKSNELDPYSVYIVDTWGTQSPPQIAHYLELADRYLDADIKIGFHGHNNKMQALSCAEKAIEMNLNHDLCIDASIMGMGRGAGNLNTEIIMQYMNTEYEKNYNIYEILDIFVSDIQKIYETTSWGYSLYYYLSAVYGCNPNFATYFEEKNYDIKLFEKFLNGLTEQEKIVFNDIFVETKLSNT